MPDPMIAVHEAALDEIRRREREIDDEKGLIEAAKSYHWSALKRLGVTPVGDAIAHESSNGSGKATWQLHEDRAFREGLEQATKRLAGLTKHDAAAVALEEIGPVASVPMIVDWLRSREYGHHIQRKMMVNGMRTALNRKPEMFEPIGDGRWRYKKWAEKLPDKA